MQGSSFRHRRPVNERNSCELPPAGKGKPAYGSRKASAADLSAFDDDASMGTGTARSEMDSDLESSPYDDCIDMLLEKRCVA